MIRHILIWKYTDTVKAEHKEAEALAFLQKSVATMSVILKASAAQKSIQTLPAGSTISYSIPSCGMQMPYKHSKIIRCILPTGSAARPL